MKSPCLSCAIYPVDHNANGCAKCDSRVKYCAAIATGVNKNIMPPKFDDIEWAKKVQRYSHARPVEKTKKNIDVIHPCLVPGCTISAQYQSIDQRFPGRICQLHRNRMRSRKKWGVPLDRIEDLTITTRKAMAL